METVNESQRLFDDEQVADRFLDHYDDIRGKVRVEIIQRHLADVVLRDPPLKVIDVGCGDGRDVLWLANQGHEVVGLDSSKGMLDRARTRLKNEGSGTGSVEFIDGTADQAIEIYGPQAFDLVLSHGVLSYQNDEREFVRNHVGLARAGGHISILTKNANALASGVANQGRLEEALRLLDDSNSVGHLGVAMTAHTIDEVADLLLLQGATVVSWAGVRIFSDGPLQDADDADPKAIIDLEWRAARQDRYRNSASLIHVIALNGIDTSNLDQY